LDIKLTEASLGRKLGPVPDGVPLDGEVIELTEGIGEDEVLFRSQVLVVDVGHVFFGVRLIWK
jgi:hypothetical protein